MTSQNETPFDESIRLAATRGRGWLATVGSIVGVGGTLVCSLSMVAVSVGLFVAGGATALQGGMAGMDSMDQGGPEAGVPQAPGWLDVILRFGPEILIVSLLLVAASVALRRPVAVLPAIGGGLVLYVGMYVQPGMALMYGAIVVGTVLLIGAYVASLRSARRDR